MALTGCTGSRWAKGVADYDKKYPLHTDNVRRMAKQAIDARHVATHGGVYAAGSGSADPVGGGAELGVFYYPYAHIETRGGLAGFVFEDNTGLPSILGLSGSVRLQTPSRLAPFVGLGGSIGWAGKEVADHDGIDNDDDTFIDESGEQANDYDIVAFPEAGVHYWVTPQFRLTASASYPLGADYAPKDFLMYGVSLSYLRVNMRPPAPACGTPNIENWRDATAADQQRTISDYGAVMTATQAE